MKLTRRDFFKGVGAGTALAGLGSLARPAPAAAGAGRREHSGAHVAVRGTGGGIRTAGTSAGR